MAAVRRLAGGNHWVSTLDESFWWEYFYGDEHGRATDLGEGSFNNELRRCRAFVDFCVRRGWMEQSVAEYLRTDIRNRKPHLRQHLILTPAQLLQLTQGSVLELDRKVGEAIDIYVNNRLVARGEVVIVDERLGVTMTEIIKDGDNAA